MLHVCVCVYMWVRPHLCACVRYPSVCPVMKAVSMRTNPTISTSRLNDRDIFTLSVTEGRGERKSEKREEGGQHYIKKKNNMSQEPTTTVKNDKFM